MRDNQRAKVYNFENEHLASEANLTLEDCQLIVDTVCRHYDVRPVTVTDGRGRRKACYSDLYRQIKLPRWARSEEVVLHECAHMLVASRYRRKDVADHGPEFVGAFVELLVHHGYDQKRLAAMLNDARIDFTAGWRK